MKMKAQHIKRFEKHLNNAEKAIYSMKLLDYKNGKI